MGDTPSPDTARRGCGLDGSGGLMAALGGRRTLGSGAWRRPRRGPTDSHSRRKSIARNHTTQSGSDRDGGGGRRVASEAIPGSRLTVGRDSPPPVVRQFTCKPVRQESIGRSLGATRYSFPTRTTVASKLPVCFFPTAGAAAHCHHRRECPVLEAVAPVCRAPRQSRRLS